MSKYSKNPFGAFNPYQLLWKFPGVMDAVDRLYNPVSVLGKRKKPPVMSVVYPPAQRTRVDPVIGYPNVPVLEEEKGYEPPNLSPNLDLIPLIQTMLETETKKKRKPMKKAKVGTHYHKYPRKRYKMRSLHKVTRNGSKLSKTYYE